MAVTTSKPVYRSVASGIGVERRQAAYAERRHHADLWTSALHGMSCLTYFLVAISAIFFFLASPIGVSTTSFEIESLDQLSKGPAFFFYMMLTGVVISLVGLGINEKRSRRRYDDDHSAVMILGMISFVGILVYLFFV